MGNYRISIKPSAVKELEDIPRKDRLRIIGRIKALADDPRPPGSEKLTGQDKYRVRQGSYRIIYSVSDAEPSIIVVKIGHRRDVYN